MTSRERWLATLRREPADRVPMDYWGTAEVTQALMRHLGVPSREGMYERLHVDRPVFVEPLYVGPPIEPDTNMYGIRTRPVSWGEDVINWVAMSPLEGFATVEQIEASYGWPSPDWFDYSTVSAQATAHPDRPIQYKMAGVYSLYTMLRGMEQALVDFAMNHEIVLHCMERLIAFHYEKAARVFEAARGRVDLAWIHNDLGSQDDLLCSPQTVRKLFVPGITRMAALCHQAGATVCLHSDGAISKAIPDLIAAGIDLLNPIQWRCPGMEREVLKERFGEALIFHGAMDNQVTLASGNEDAVRREVRENIEILGAGGGYILAPCAHMLPITEPEIIVAMYEEGYAVGRR
jgi:uroporphyrinogen decarboxylase